MLTWFFLFKRKNEDFGRVLPVFLIIVRVLLCGRSYACCKHSAVLTIPFKKVYFASIVIILQSFSCMVRDNQFYWLSLGDVGRWTHMRILCAPGHVRVGLVILNVTFLRLILTRTGLSRSCGASRPVIVLNPVGVDAVTWRAARNQTDNIFRRVMRKTIAFRLRMALSSEFLRLCSSGRWCVRRCVFLFSSEEMVEVDGLWCHRLGSLLSFCLRVNSEIPLQLTTRVRPLFGGMRFGLLRSCAQWYTCRLAVQIVFCPASPFTMKISHLRDTVVDWQHS